MGDLTAHFSLWEFQSRDGEPMPEEVKKKIERTAKMLEKLRKALSENVGRDCPLKVLSGYRSPAHNKVVGGVTNSYHLRGMAADVICPHASPRLVQSVSKALQSDGVIGGVGSYPGFTHVDWGPKRSWSQGTKSSKGGAKSP